MNEQNLPPATQPPPTYQAPPPQQQPPQVPYQPVGTNGLAIAGFILTFIVPIVGLILCIISLKQIKKKPQGGRGLAIAGVILSTIFTIISTFMLAIILATVPALQSKAADTQRLTDINSLNASLSAHYAEEQYYPTLDQLNDTSWRATNLTDIGEINIVDPNAVNGLFSDSPKRGSYSYEASPTGCNNIQVTCTSYRLGATFEDGSIYTKEPF